MESAVPAAEVELGAEAVRELLRAQMPDLSDLPLHAVDSGWDNAIFRLGDRWAVRLPRRRAAVALTLNEQRWLPVLAPSLGLPVPTPKRVGVPSAAFPWPWSVVPWHRGHTADTAPPGDHEAERWSGFLRSLHRPAPPDAPFNPFRTVTLRDRDADVRDRAGRAPEIRAAWTPQLEAAWTAAVTLEPPASPVWIHGDLHPRNILTEEGRFSAVIDWGDLSYGDAATDLASIWMLFADRVGRDEALAAYGAAREAVVRARGWAVFFAVLLAGTGLDTHGRVGRATLDRLLEDLASD